MRDIVQLLERWQLDVGEVRRRMYLASTPRERERWHALWLLAQGWTASAVAEERDSHTIGMWVTALGTAVLRPFPSQSLDGDQQAQVKAAVARKGWHRLGELDWKVVRRFVQERFGRSLSPVELPASLGVCTETAEGIFLSPNPPKDGV